MRRKKTLSPTEAFDTAAHKERMSRETDYAARMEFLAAISEVMEPAPLETLVAVLPAFREWFAPLYAPQPETLLDNLTATAALLRCKLSAIDDSPEGTALRRAIVEWMAGHKFADEWIGNIALSTLGRAVVDGSALAWWMLADPEKMLPVFRFAASFQRGETRDQFRKRAEARFKHELREYLAMVDFRWGARKGQLQAAGWTADVFTGATYSDDARRKAVAAFAKRAGLTLPPRDPQKTQ